jgi:hypothetical protein
MTATKIDREWPYQVAPPADHVLGPNYCVTHDFCRGLSLCPRGRTVLRGSVNYTIFCFADPAHADLFRERFSGEWFNPKERGRGNEWLLWRKR